jgi:hypothetical protein
VRVQQGDHVHGVGIIAVKPFFEVLYGTINSRICGPS